MTYIMAVVVGALVGRALYETWLYFQVRTFAETVEEYVHEAA